MNATDADSPVLHYTWTLDGVTVRSGDGVDNLSHRFTSPGSHQLRVVVADNGTSDQRQWQVTVEEAPPGLVQLLTPANGSVFGAHTSVNVTGSVSSLIENTTIEWRLDGVVFSTTLGGSTVPLEPGIHTISMRVIGLYNGVVPYNVTIEVRVVIQSPPTDGCGSACPPPPPPPIDSTFPVALFIVAIGVSLGLVLYLYYRFRRRAPPSQPPEPPAD